MNRTVQYCPVCRRPLGDDGKVEVKPTWSLAWGLLWKFVAIMLPLELIGVGIALLTR